MDRQAGSDGSDEAHLVYRTLDGEDAHLPRVAIEPLRAALRGDVSVEGDPAYEEARRVWNAMVDHRPCVIAHCTTADDVREAIQFARTHSMLLSVRGGGHHIAGNAVADRGLMIDLSRMSAVRVDPNARTARVGGGALLADVDHATQAHGLATPLGVNSTTGFAGLCLGGGFGWLTRKYGLTLDNLRSAEIVTADGTVRKVSASSEPDLFWAIRGGGGNFGVVTSFDVQLHPVGPMVHAGLVVYPGEAARDVLRSWHELTKSAPDELAVWAVLRKAPPLPFLPADVHGKNVVLLLACYAGPAEEGARQTAVITRFGTPHAALLALQPYEAFQKTVDPLLGPGMRNYWKTNEFVDLDDDVLDALRERAFGTPSHHAEVIIASLGGAMGRVPVEATAYAGRDASYVMNVHGRWEEPSLDEAVRTWARGIFEATAPHATGGGYVNFMSMDDGARVKAAYGVNYERLRELKRRYDPDNLFRMNHNIPPLEADVTGRGRRGTRGSRPARAR
jgi:FAD/FMN-containing dehydrogenase